ncbi:ubiquinol--cytochrome-c reductase subunit 6 [Coemansia javaensis]|uniref:Ubiquinol--cytochrome-c reductase subunit 6 n=1 Tax=Coemansia javaensis TaxID=2761396 RepID=A0A9W8H222_9FUNG|nr:ubiquinol--cytochrome-c reductase subunit 6 [Coemansia javaensis]
MGFFDAINPFGYGSTVHAEAPEAPVAITADAVAVIEAAKDGAAEAVEAEAETEAAVEEAEAEAEEAEAEAEEEEEPEDPASAIKEACAATMACKSLQHHLDECAKRVDEGAHESCAEEFLLFMECVGSCAAEKIFAKLK